MFNPAVRGREESVYQNLNLHLVILHSFAFLKKINSRLTAELHC
jgi:hypothetical protein